MGEMDDQARTLALRFKEELVTLKKNPNRNEWPTHLVVSQDIYFIMRLFTGDETPTRPIIVTGSIRPGDWFYVRSVS